MIQIEVIIQPNDAFLVVPNIRHHFLRKLDVAEERRVPCGRKCK